MRIFERRLVSMLAVLVAAALSIGAAPTNADREKARTLFNDALDLRATGDHKTALSKLQAADALVPTPRIRLELGREQMLVGQLVEAYSTLNTVPSVPYDAV